MVFWHTSIIQYYFSSCLVLYSVPCHFLIPEPKMTPVSTDSRYRWINSLRQSDAIWRHRSRSTLIQVMACCLMAPSHYLNQCWLIISKVQGHSSDGNFTRLWVKSGLSLKITYVNFHSHRPGDSELSHIFIPLALTANSLQIRSKMNEESFFQTDMLFILFRCHPRCCTQYQLAWCN